MDKILINGEALDFSGSYNISLEANDFLNFKPGTAYKSERLTIYNTPKNRRLLGNIFHINADTSATFDALFITDIIQMAGVLQILNVDQQKAEAVFISGNGKMWDELKGTKLLDIDCSEFNHTLNYNTVTASETYNEANFYIYDFCNRGDLIDPLGINITERFPAISLRNLIGKIFSGYTLAGDLIDEAWFKRIFLMFSQPFEIRNTDDWKTSALIDIGMQSDQTENLTIIGGLKAFTLAATLINLDDENTPHLDNGSNFLGKLYTVPETGTYRFKFNTGGNGVLTLSYIGGNTITGDIVVSIKNNGTTIVSQSFTVDSSINTFNVIDLDTQLMEFTKDDEIGVYVYVYGNYTNNMSSVTLTLPNSCTLVNSISRWYGSGSTVDFSKILPDIDTLSFLHDVFIYFGIYPFYNIEERTINFYQLKSDSTLLDISDKIDQEAGVEFEIPEKANYYLKFADDSTDKQMKYAIDNGLMSDGNYLYSIGEKATNEIKLRYFCNTFFDTFLINNVSSTFKVPIFWCDLKSVKFSTKFGLRLLYYEGTDAMSYTLFHGAESNVISHARTAAPVFSNNTTVNLQFTGTDGMYKYQSRVLQMVTEGKSATCTAILNPNIISKYYTGENFRVPVYINSPYVSGRFMVLKLRQKAGNLFELSLLQKFD